MEGEWRNFVNMTDKRSAGAGIVYDNTFHIFGGNDYDKKTKLQSSEIVNEDGSSNEGPQLLTAIAWHAIASINSTVSIITGGVINNYEISDRTWYFSHATQEFWPGPSLLEKRSGHSSATITDQETKEKISIVAGGYYTMNGYLSSTELLIKGEWEKGKNNMKLLVCPFVPF